MPVILVELPAADSTDPNVPALIRACTEGLHEGECALKDAGSAQPAAVAIVSWLDPEHEHARLEVVSRAGAHGAWRSRELGFREQDAPLERWRALGFAIAGMVGEVLPPSPPTEPKPKPEPEPTPPPEPTSKPARAGRLRAPAAPPARPWHTGLGVQLARGLDSAPSAGAWLELGRTCCGNLPLSFVVSAADSFSVTRSAGVSARFTTLALGAGVELEPLTDFELDATLLGLVDQLRVQAIHPESGAEASAHRTLLGGALQADAAWPHRSSIAISVGGELVSLSGATGIHLFGQQASESPAIRWGFRAGLRFRF